MNKSQSSDVFSEKDLSFCMEEDNNLEITFHKIKSALSQDVKLECGKAAFSLFFSNTLLGCADCVNQKLELIGIILEDPENLTGKLTEILDEIISILQMLSSFLKNVLEAVTMSCKSLKTFPITTGQILLNIFTHCKESENLYGTQLKFMEKQLKDLFKACHELQIIYLMILEKHFIFDLSETQELDVLINALEINLQIGEVVQALDLKTMAEQWKAYAMICERYSHYLIDKHMFQDSSQCLCNMITINVGIPYEQEAQKAVMRSFKVANIAIKILVKLCHIFKHAVDKRLDHIVKLLVDVQMKHPSIVGSNENSPQLTQAINTNVFTPLDSLVLELLNEDVFIQCFAQYNKRSNRTDTSVGYLLLMISVMKCLIQSVEEVAFTKWMSDTESNLFRCLFYALGQGHTSLNLDYKFNLSSNAYCCGLFEYLLIHTSLLVIHCSDEQYGILENAMLRALLLSDMYSAMFASDLWLSLARISPPNITVNQLVYLCGVYDEVSAIPGFATSPPNTYLSLTISRLFKCLSKEDKYKVYDDFDLKYDSNRNLWTVMKIKNLPDSIQRNAEGMVVHGLKTKLKEVLNSESVKESDLFDLVLQFKLAATCSFVVSENIIHEVVNAWLFVCPETNQILQSNSPTQQNKWFVEYIEALQALTVVLLRHFQRNSQSLIKVLHVISKITSNCCTEIKLSLISAIFKLSLCDVESNAHTVEKLLHDIFKNIFTEKRYVFKTKLFELALQQIRNIKVQDLVSRVTHEDIELEREWKKIQYKIEKRVIDQLKDTESMEYIHKCLPSIQTVQLITTKTKSVKCISPNSDNFEFADIEGLLNNQDSESQPALKKAKSNPCEVDDLLNKLDSYTLNLSKLNIPIDIYRERIIALSERLRNMVEPSI